MVNTCCVTNCFTGYKSKKHKPKNLTKIPRFQFPVDKDVRDKWIRTVPRKDWEVTPCHRVCALHFTEDDFIKNSCDSNKRRKRGTVTSRLSRIRLKPTAVPHIFPSLPSYLSKPNTAPRSEKCSASARLALENSAIQACNNNFLKQEKIANLRSLKGKIEHETLPSGYVIAESASLLHFHYIHIAKDINQSPKLLASVVVTEDLHVRVYIDSLMIPHLLYNDLMSSGQLETTSELCNILSRCKSICDDKSQQGGVDNYRNISFALAFLESYVSLQSDTHSPDLWHVTLVKFVIEQLQLMQIPKTGRRYSPNLIMTAFLWKLTSNALYKKLRNLFALPSVSRLRELSKDLTVESGELDLTYLRSRTAHLTDKEKIVTLMVDEVYTAQRVEYANGAFTGLTEDGLPAKTVLAFMVQSLHGKYKDVVCLIPVNKLDTALLRKWLDHVLRLLNDILLVIAISVDNHVCNRKLFVELCDGHLQHSIPHPVREGEKMFLIFDFTHNLKNIFNHFVNKNLMHPPASNHEDILGKSCTARFYHLVRLYALEEDNPLKIAYSLKKVSLNPSSIARTSPQHALNVFHESTVRGLEYFGRSYPEFKKTARYVEFIMNIWNVMSVKSPSKATRKRNPFFKPLQITDEEHHGITFLKKAIAIFKEWKDSGNSGLTRETFLACIQTMGAILELAEYLQINHGFCYLLTGKVMSDPIEARFGMYRQANGGNFFMSVKQLFLAEKKIRCLSFLQQQALGNAASISKFPVKDYDEQQCEDDCQWLAKFLTDGIFVDLTNKESAVAFYVSGYIGRSIVRRRKCHQCKEMLIANHDVSEFDDSIPDSYKEILDMADRGGLAEPTELCFGITAIALQCYSTIMDHDAITDKLMSTGNQRQVFVGAVREFADSSPFLRSYLNAECSSSHKNFELNVQSAFNCFAKNELRRFNDKPVQEVPAKKLRTVRKLSSKGSSKQ